MNPSLINTGEGFNEAAHVWIHATLQLPGRVVQVYVRRTLGQAHRPIVAEGVTLESLERVMAAWSSGPLMEAVRGLLVTLKERDAS